jgi:hypothetical protein
MRLKTINEEGLDCLLFGITGEKEKELKSLYKDVIEHYNKNFLEHERVEQIILPAIRRVFSQLRLELPDGYGGDYIIFKLKNKEIRDKCWELFEYKSFILYIYEQTCCLTPIFRDRFPHLDWECELVQINVSNYLHGLVKTVIDNQKEEFKKLHLENPNENGLVVD